ncbi:hypothetical protein [Streptomyces longwoodensis]|uniref:hypothetical protein n=1 Tax=Streptomyces longwoodensis TaxID=68231 RepID=UPI0030E50848
MQTGLAVVSAGRASLNPDLPLTRVPCAGNPHSKFVSGARSGTDARPAVAAALTELRELASSVAS